MAATRKAKPEKPPRANSSRRSKRSKPKTPRGKIGQETYEAVRKLVDGGLAVGKAFEQVAKATGRKASTVAVTYYRLARRNVAGPPKRRGRLPGSRKPPGRTSALKVMRRVAAAIKELEDLLAHQSREIVRLSKESKLSDLIRKVLRE